jgi:hypothetical protein
MRRLIALTAVGIVAATSVVAGSSASASEGGQTITLYARTTAFHFSDTPPLNQANAGDGFTLGEVLYRHGQRVGTAAIVCTAVVAHQTLFCTGSWTIRGAQIEVSGTLPDESSKPSTLGVTGGTGRYTGAEGTLTVIPSEGNHEGDVFHLR